MCQCLDGPFQTTMEYKVTPFVHYNTSTHVVYTHDSLIDACIMPCIIHGPLAAWLATVKTNPKAVYSSVDAIL